MDKTLEYYNKKAHEFVNNTVSVNFTDTQDLFLEYLPENGYILDFGCGSGRDTKYFKEKGYKIEAIDGSEELCQIASEYSGIKVECMLFQDLNENDQYDGIWACASILHLSKTEMKDVLKKMIRSLKKNGIIYTSFKYGEFE
ncbi:MAG: class I SAM-dependent methyltransferase, partial [Lachnospiraceae bacterium]|nr:class I SAM-dependent methyltransferase [Lachnospiraceae bacterium]